MIPSPRPPVVLAIADYYGTLAAARALGRAGVEVVVADWRRLVPARWSRFVSRSVTCPDLAADPDAFLAWLLELGARRPGQVLCATSDDLAWLFARHRADLDRVFRLDMPPLDAVYTLLNKWRLQRACEAVGLDVPAGWLPRDEAELERLGREARFPLLVKPQTQVLLSPHQKGRIVRGAETLAPLYRDFVACTRHAPALLASDADASRPLLQAFVEGAAEGIYNLSGFVDESGETFVALASRKVLQRPRLLGIGLCFEEAEVVPSLAERVRALCRSVGYHGVFEVEFLEDRGRHLLIDFNPRFYGQMAFDVARGAPLPLLAYHAAVGDRQALRAAANEAARAGATTGQRVYRNRIQLEVFGRLQRLAGGMDAGDARRWREWMSRHRDAVDPVLDRQDWVPGVVDAASILVQSAIHPRSTWRMAAER